jgi:hypothetical protein
VVERRAVLRYRGLVPQSVRDELDTIIDAAFHGLSDDNVESRFYESVMAIKRTLYNVAVSNPPWSDDDFRTNVDDLIDQLIDQSYTWLYDRPQMYIVGPANQPSDRGGSTLDGFRTRLRAVLHTSPAWKLETIQHPPSSSDPPSELVSVQNAAKQLDVSEDTIRRNRRGEYEIVRVSERRLCVTQRSIDRVKASARWQFDKR